MSLNYSYRHLYYFWVVAKEGGIARAAARLGMAVQTVSAQVHALELALGHALLKPAGRSVALTEAGQAALQQADAIFALGEHLPSLVREAATRPGLRLAVGISDGLPKLVVHRLMQPLLAEPMLRLRCLEAEFADLLADLALHRLDVVLADRPPVSNANLRVYGHAMASSPVAWYAAARWQADAAQDFPRSLQHVPVLLPTAHAAVRLALDTWFDRIGVRPNVVGEFEDSALLKTFGAGGLGVFPAATLVHDDIVARYGVARCGDSDGVVESYWIIGTEKRVRHPLVQRLLPA